LLRACLRGPNDGTGEQCNEFASLHGQHPPNAHCRGGAMQSGRGGLKAIVGATALLGIAGIGSQATFFTAGMVQLPLMIDGLRSFGQYMRSMRTNLPAGAGSQFDSLSGPGESFWM
jgi:hypothetical protein